MLVRRYISGISASFPGIPHLPVFDRLKCATVSDDGGKASERIARYNRQLYTKSSTITRLDRWTGLVASFPGPRPASRRLQYGTASDGKLGGGLGTRLGKS